MFPVCMVARKPLLPGSAVPWGKAPSPAHCSPGRVEALSQAWHLSIFSVSNEGAEALSASPGDGTSHCHPLGK